MPRSQLGDSFTGAVLQTTVNEHATAVDALEASATALDARLDMLEPAVTALVGRPYDIRTGFLATPTANQVLDRIMVPRTLTLPANLAGSAGAIVTWPGSSLVLTLKDDGVTIGTVTISTAGVFAFATTNGTAKTVAAGSLLTLTAPAVAVTNAADAVITLLGTV